MKFLLLMWGWTPHVIIYPGILSCKLYVSMFCSQMLCEVSCWVYGSGQKFRARARCTPHTQILPLIFNQFEIMGIPPSLRSHCWLWSLHACHDDWLWNESPLLRRRRKHARAAEAVSRSNLSLGNITLCPTEKGTSLQYHIFCSNTLHYFITQKSSCVTVTRYFVNHLYFVTRYTQHWTLSNHCLVLKLFVCVWSVIMPTCFLNWSAQSLPLRSASFTSHIQILSFSCQHYISFDTKGR